MKQLIRNLGLILFIIAVALLVYGTNSSMTSNTILIASGAMIILGLIVHVIMNKKMD
ncbi:MAG: hypothetical protein ACOCWM_00290 [Cyclobacteriaceae bacterium]